MSMMPKALGSDEQKARINRILSEIASTPEGHALLAGRPAGEEPCRIAFDHVHCAWQGILGSYSTAQNIALVDPSRSDAEMFVIISHELVHERQYKDGVSPDLSGDPAQNAAILKAMEADAYAREAQIAWEYRTSQRKNALPVWDALTKIYPDVAKSFESACRRNVAAADSGEAKIAVFCDVLAGDHPRMARSENAALQNSILQPVSGKTVQLPEIFGKLGSMDNIPGDTRLRAMNAAMAESQRVRDCNQGLVQHAYTRLGRPMPQMEIVPIPRTFMERMRGGVANVLSSMFNTPRKPVMMGFVSGDPRPPEMK